MGLPNISHLSPSAEIDFGLPKQRTDAGLAYERFYKRASKLGYARDEKSKAAAKAFNDEFLELRDLKPGQVQASTVLSEMSVMYANDEYIGTRLMPIYDIGKRVGEFYEYAKRDRLAYPDDEMEVRSEALEVSEGRTRTPVSLQGRALKEFVDVTVLNNQDAPLNEMLDAQQNVLEGLSFKQEKRIATIMCASASYGSNTTALSAGDRWDSVSGGDPVADINAALAAQWIGRGPGKRVAFASLDVWNVLKVHPRMLDLIRGNSSGMLTREMFSAFFEIDELLIGKARNDTANSGQTASYSRIWSNVFGVARVGLTPSKRNAVFGWTFREKPIVNRSWFDPKTGEEGGWFSQASHADKSQVVAADTGFLIDTPIG